jgi:PAS domain S-box-containing protein
VTAVLILSVIELALHKKNLISDELGSVLFTIAFIVIGFLLIYFTSRELSRIEQQRTKAEDELKQANENLEVMVAERTKALAEREHLLKSLFDNTDASILVKGLDGVYTMGNRAFHQTFNIPADGMTNKTVQDLAPQDMVARQILADQEVLKTGASIVYEVKAPTTKGERYFRTNKFPIFDDQNNITGIGTMSTDISELKKEKADQEMLATFFHEQNRQLVSFSHVLAHNLRSPVVNLKTIIRFYHETHDPIKKAAFLEKISSLIANLSVTFDEMMEIIMIRQDISKEKQLLSFEEVFNKTKEILSGQILEAEATVTHSFDVNSIHYPKVYLDSIFLNLMSNGIKYRSPNRKATLHVETRLENNQVVLQIKDNGLGIDMEKYGSLLFNLNKTFHNNPDAKGVGLYITKTQVEAMGGTITADSKVDVGSTFIITFC